MIIFRNYLSKKIITEENIFYYVWLVKKLLQKMILKKKLLRLVGGKFI